MTVYAAKTEVKWIVCYRNSCDNRFPCVLTTIFFFSLLAQTEKQMGKQQKKHFIIFYILKQQDQTIMWALLILYTYIQIKLTDKVPLESPYSCQSITFRSLALENGCIYATTQFPWLHLISPKGTQPSLSTSVILGVYSVFQTYTCRYLSLSAPLSRVDTMNEMWLQFIMKPKQESDTSCRHLSRTAPDSHELTVLQSIIKLSILLLFWLWPKLHIARTFKCELPILFLINLILCCKNVFLVPSGPVPLL